MEEDLSRFEISGLVQAWLAQGANSKISVGCNMLDEFPIFILDEIDVNNLQ